MNLSEIDQKYYDISPPVDARTAVFPGDTAFSRNVSMSFAKGHHLELSDIHSTLHIGAHADAPSHYHQNGETIDRRDLNVYMGQAQVITVKKNLGERIMLSDLPVPIKAPRVLFKTNSFNDPNRWHDNFNSLSSELIIGLAQKGVKLVGIDTPSVDPATEKTLSSHSALYETDMGVLEGIILKDVPDGLYTLIALPLNLLGADASPVRAILLPEQH